MKKVVVLLLATLVSSCMGQSANSGCLVVRSEGHKFAYVASTGRLPVQLQYSRKDMRSLMSQGVSTIVISKKTLVVDPLAGCRQDDRTAVAFHPVQETKTGAKVTRMESDDLSCTAWIVTKSGEQTCIDHKVPDTQQ